MVNRDDHDDPGYGTPGADDAAPEDDPRFPSGPWIGYYEQWGVRSRQRLGLAFAGGRVRGEGRDPAGEFLVTGRYDPSSGGVWMSKTYTSHTVEYDARADDDGIAGDWCIVYFGGLLTDRGRFRIWPDLSGRAETSHAHAEADAPADR